MRTILAENIRRERVRRRLTQQQVAARCGLYQSDISRIERGERPLSLDDVLRLADVFGLPLQWFVTGDGAPGPLPADLAQELRALGLVDLIVPGERVVGAFRPPEEVLALAVGTERPDPRIVEGLPAVLAWNRWRVELLDAFARVTHRRALTRLAWLAQVTLTIDRSDGFPGGLLSADELTTLLDRVERPHDADDLGHAGEATHPVWKYWRIGYAATLATFRERAETLSGLKGGGYARAD